MKDSITPTIIKVKCEDSRLMPVKGTEFSAGYDLRYSGEVKLLYPWERAIFPTGIFLEMPEFTYGKIEPRSGLAAKHGIVVLAGVIDSDYRGEIKIILYNSDPKLVLRIEKFERIAQIIFHTSNAIHTLIQVNELSDTARGDGGFGSTGVK